MWPISCHFLCKRLVPYASIETGSYDAARRLTGGLQDGPHKWPSGMPIVASYISDEIREQAKKRFKESLEKFIGTNCDKTVTYRVRTGKNWEEIIKAADNWEADLIVCYHNHRREINEVFSGSCSQRVSDNANCSVLRLRNVLS